MFEVAGMFVITGICRLTSMAWLLPLLMSTWKGPGGLCCWLTWLCVHSCKLGRPCTHATASYIGVLLVAVIAKIFLEAIMLEVHVLCNAYQKVCCILLSICDLQQRGFNCLPCKKVWQES